MMNATEPPAGKFPSGNPGGAATGTSGGFAASNPGGSATGTSGGSTAGTPPAGSGDALRRMRDDAAGLKQEALEATHDTTATLREHGRDAAGSLREEAENLADKAQHGAADLAEQGKQAGAAQVQGLASAVRGFADDLEGRTPELARHVRTAADSVGGIADALRDRSVGELLEDVRDLARRQPAAVFGAAALAGFAFIRFARSSAAATGSASRGGTGHHQPALAGGLAGHAPGWAPSTTTGGTTGGTTPAKPLTLPAASLGGAAAHQPGSATPGSMPTTPPGGHDAL